MKKSAEIENKICVFVNNVILIQETMSLTPLHLCVQAENILPYALSIMD